MSTTPEVSVVIATRDRWPTLSQSGLPSALSQRDVELEVVVVDDCSSDETPARLAEVGDPRVRVVSNSSTLKLPAARNVGIAVAEGEWLAFLDDDDLWSPRKLRAQLDMAERSGSAWVYGAAIVVDERRNVIEADPFPAPNELPELLLHGNWIPGGGSNVIARSEAVRRVGAFDEQLRFFEDWDLWLRLLEVGLPGACDEVVVARVEHRHNMVLRDRSQVIPAFERLLGKHREVTRDDRLSVAQWLAYEQYRGGKRGRAAAMYLEIAVRYGSAGNLPPALGALFGDRGMRLASRMLVALRGASHVEPATAGAPVPPDWLEAYR